MPGKAPKEIRAWLKAAESQGFEVRYTKGSHIQVRNPSGRVIAGSGSTPSEYRAIKNFRAQLRRGGVTL